VSGPGVIGRDCTLKRRPDAGKQGFACPRRPPPAQRAYAHTLALPPKISEFESGQPHFRCGKSCGAGALRSHFMSTPCDVNAIPRRPNEHQFMRIYWNLQYFPSDFPVPHLCTFATVPPIIGPERRCRRTLFTEIGGPTAAMSWSYDSAFPTRIATEYIQAAGSPSS
jgi:hypothetical protein